MITVDDLYNWMDEYEEDPIVDGPICITRQDQEEFVNGLNKQIVDVEEYDHLSIGGGGWNDEQEKYIVDCLVDFLNRKQYPNDYARDLERDNRQGYENSESTDEGELEKMTLSDGGTGERLRVIMDNPNKTYRIKQPTIKDLEAEMRKAVREENYEKAAELRDRINAMR